MKYFLALIEVVFIGIVLFVISLTYITPSSAFAQACTAPATVSDVKVTYPDCSDTQCLFTQANCSWTAVTGATSYQINVTEVDSNTVVKNQSVDAGTTKVIFPVTSGKTYKCDVTAVNSCGQSGGTGSDTLLCKVDGVTSAPTAIPTIPPVINQPKPTLPPTGSTESMVIIGSIIGLFSLIGIGLLIL